MVIDPAGLEQSGCEVMFTVGAVGIGGGGSMVIRPAPEVQPLLFLAVIPYNPGTTPVKTVDAWYGPPIL